VRRRALAVLVLGIACVSTAAILITLASREAQPLAIAAWRMLFAAALLAPVALWVHVGGRGTRPASGDGRWLVGAGLMLALHFALWISSLGLTSVASSVVLVTTSPLWVALAEPIVFKRRHRPKLLAGVALAFAGGAAIALGDRGASESALLGDALALGGALAAAAYFLAGRRLRAHLDVVTYAFLVYGLAAVVLTLVCLVRGVPLAPYSAEVWLLLFLLALGPQVLGHSSFNWALGHLSATYVTAAVLGEALGSTLLAWWFLDQQPPPSTWLGGALILTGLVVAGSAEAGLAPPEEVGDLV
jgi:drug/metabolite transporter (DMT)-like permease